MALLLPALDSGGDAGMRGFRMSVIGAVQDPLIASRHRAEGMRSYTWEEASKQRNVRMGVLSRNLQTGKGFLHCLSHRDQGEKHMGLGPQALLR